MNSVAYMFPQAQHRWLKIDEVYDLLTNWTNYGILLEDVVGLLPVSKDFVSGCF